MKKRGGKREKAGRSPYIGNVWPGKRIYDLIPEDGTRIQYKELRGKVAKTGISFDTLHRYLPDLERTSQILREVDATTRPPTVWYRRLIEDFYPEGKDFYLDIVQDRGREWDRILKIEPFDKRTIECATRLALELSGMAVFVDNVLAYALRGMPPDVANEYLDVVMKIHLYPWIHRLASFVYRENGLDKWELECAKDIMGKVLEEVAAIRAGRSVPLWVKSARKVARAMKRTIPKSQARPKKHKGGENSWK